QDDPAGRVQAEGRLEDGARVPARGSRLQRRRAQQVVVGESVYSAGAGGGPDGTGGVLLAGPRNGRCSITNPAASAATTKMSAATKTHRNTAAMSTPAAPALATIRSTPAPPRSGAAPSVPSRIAPMIATASVLASARKKFIAPVAVPT